MSASFADLHADLLDKTGEAGVLLDFRLQEIHATLLAGNDLVNPARLGASEAVIAGSKSISASVNWITLKVAWAGLA